jgi:transposase
MLNLGRRRVFLCRKSVDMRKAFDSLADLVRVELAMDPFQGDVFVFVGKDRTRAKVLIWETTGFWLCAKRLESARFRLPAAAEHGVAAALPLTIEQITSLLSAVIPRVLHRPAATSA